MSVSYFVVCFVKNTRKMRKVYSWPKRSIYIVICDDYIMHPIAMKFWYIVEHISAKDPGILPLSYDKYCAGMSHRWV